MIRNIILFTVIFLHTSILAQEAFNFSFYSEMKHAKRGLLTDKGIWAATEGGIFFWNSADSSYLKLTKTDGLNGTLVNALAVDKNDRLWMGSINGKIDVYDPSTGVIDHIFDIFNSNKNLKMINKLFVNGDSIFVASEFGLSIIDAKTYDFLDSFVKFGSMTSNTSVQYVMAEDILYLATTSGLAKQKPNATNLSAPESWEIYDRNHGLPSKDVHKIARYKGDLIVSTDLGFAKWNGSVWEKFLPELGQLDVKDFLIDGEKIYILRRYFNNNHEVNEYYFYSGSNLSLPVKGIPVCNEFISVQNDSIYFATNNGVLIFAGGEKNYLFPEGPFANLFSDIAVDSKGRLGVASGTDVTGVGLYILENDTWNNFSVNSYSKLKTNSIYKLFIDNNDVMYFGSWGNGIFIFENDSLIGTYNAANSPLVGINDDPNYLVIADMEKDSKGNLWILNYESADRHTLSCLTPDSSWHHFRNYSNPYLSPYSELLIDQYDTKYFVPRDRQGIYYFNEHGTLDDTDDDSYGYISSASGLIDKEVSKLVLDNRGDIWVGTDLGVNIISNNHTVASGYSPQFRIISIFGLRQQTVTALAVDPINRKWIGTNEGLLLVSPDGSKLIQSFTESNSVLPTNEIQSLAIDQNTGKVYVGTQLGLLSFETVAKEPVTSFNDIFVYPSPFVIRDGSEVVTFDGLVKDAELKILNIRGELIREYTSPGGRIAYWDGRDDNGDLVSSGVYILVASGEDGEKVTTQKIAVIRK